MIPDDQVDAESAAGKAKAFLAELTQMMGVNVGMHVYQDCSGILERNPQVKPEDGFARVDAEWLSSVLA